MSDSDFIIKSINNANWEHELEIVGFDKSYSHKFSDKFMHKNLKIYNLRLKPGDFLGVMLPSESSAPIISFFNYYYFFCLFRAAPEACGNSQARG